MLEKSQAEMGELKTNCVDPVARGLVATLIVILTLGYSTTFFLKYGSPARYVSRCAEYDCLMRVFLAAPNEHHGYRRARRKGKGDHGSYKDEEGNSDDDWGDERSGFVGSGRATTTLAPPSIELTDSSERPHDQGGTPTQANRVEIDMNEEDIADIIMQSSDDSTSSDDGGHNTDFDENKAIRPSF